MPRSPFAPKTLRLEISREHYEALRSILLAVFVDLELQFRETGRDYPNEALMAQFAPNFGEIAARMRARNPELPTPTPKPRRAAPKKRAMTRKKAMSRTKRAAPKRAARMARHTFRENSAAQKISDIVSANGPLSTDGCIAQVQKNLDISDQVIRSTLHYLFKRGRIGHPDRKTWTAAT